MSAEETAKPGQVEAICERHANREGPLLPILHDLQAAFGYVPGEAIGEVARYLNLSRAEVYGVVTFYHDFRRTPPRPHSLKVCRAEACQAVGGREVWATASSLAADPACRVDVEAVYCLGNCPCAPSAQFDERTLGRLTPDCVSSLIAGAVGGEAS
ncbi:MAG: NAD(P)H-dependent oxidoreductase subunit E [Salinisphaeraceae bacterium]